MIRKSTGNTFVKVSQIDLLSRLSVFDHCQDYKAVFPASKALVDLSKKKKGFETIHNSLTGEYLSNVIGLIVSPKKMSKSESCYLQI